MKRYAYTEAFVLFCNGTPMEEIASVMQIPFHTLKREAEGANWQKLRSMMPIGDIVKSEEAIATIGANSPSAGRDARLAVVRANRQKNFEAVVELRDHLMTIIRRLKNEELKCEKHWHNKGSVVTAEVPPSTGDWVNIANYAQTIANMSYRALGDVPAQEGKVQSDAPPGQLNAPTITIVLPGVIAKPRQERTPIAVDIESTVVPQPALEEKTP